MLNLVESIRIVESYGDGVSGRTQHQVEVKIVNRQLVTMLDTVLEFDAHSS